MATKRNLAATRDRLQQQLKNLLPGSKKAKEIKNALADIDANIAQKGRVGGAGRSLDKPKLAEGEISSRFLGLGGMRAGPPATPGGPTLFDLVKAGGNILKEPFIQEPPATGLGGLPTSRRTPTDPGEVQGPPEAPVTGEPPEAAVEPAAPPRGAAPVAPGVPPQDPQAAPAQDPDEALVPFLGQAEQTPELAAFKALLEAPAPVFEKAAFSEMQRGMLGLLAGLRGIEATLPIIEMRRRDARDVYNSAREVRAERLSGLFQAASLAEQQKSQRFAQRVATERGARQERTVRVAEGGLALRQRAANAPPQLRLISPTQLVDFGTAINAAAQIRDFEEKFIREGMPGGLGAGLLPNFLRSSLQKETAADLQAIQQPLLSELLGAVRTIPELKGVDAFISPFGSRDEDILVSIRAMKRSTLSAVRSEIKSLKLSGFDTTGVEQLLFEKGFSGAEVQPSLIPTIPAHLSYDPGEVVADEGAP